jgi:hypothetical protein
MRVSRSLSSPSFIPARTSAPLARGERTAARPGKRGERSGRGGSEPAPGVRRHEEGPYVDYPLRGPAAIRASMACPDPGAVGIGSLL